VLASSAAVALPIAAAIMWFTLKPFGRMVEQIKAAELDGEGQGAPS